MQIDQQQKPSETLEKIYTEIFGLITQIKQIIITSRQRLSSHHAFHMKPT